jgi:hypothetical protein
LLRAPRVKRSKSFWLEMERVLFQHQAWPGDFLERRVSTNPNYCDTSVLLSQLETSGPRGSERVALIAFRNLRSFTRYVCLVLGKLDHFTALVAGCRPHFVRQQISSIKFDHFRHNIIPSIHTRQSCLRTNTTRCSRDDRCLLLWHTFLLFERSDPIHKCD